MLILPCSDKEADCLEHRCYGRREASKAGVSAPECSKHGDRGKNAEDEVLCTDL